MKTMVLKIWFPETVSNPEIKSYVQDALEHWGSSRHPADHLFGTVRAPKMEMLVNHKYEKDKEVPVRGAT